MKNRNIFLKLIAAVLSVIVILGCLAACGGDKGASSDVSSTPSESTSSDAVSSDEVTPSTPDTPSSEISSQPEAQTSQPAESTPVTSAPATSTPATSTPAPQPEPQGPTKPANELIVGKWKGMDNFTPALEQVAQVELDDVECEMMVEFTADGKMTFIVDSTTFALTYYPVFEAYFEKVAEEWAKQTGYDAIEYGAHYTNANGISPSEYTTAIIEAVGKAVNMTVRYKFENGKCFIGDPTGAVWEENPVEFTNDNTMIDKTNNNIYTRVS